MNARQSRRTFVSIILSAFGILAGNGRLAGTPEIIAGSAGPVTSRAVPSGSSRDSLPDSTTYVYDHEGRLIRTIPMDVL
jgi:hypothetical protein